MYIPKVGQTIMIKRPSGVGGTHYGIGDVSWGELESKTWVVELVSPCSAEVDGSLYCIPLDSVHPILLEDNV